MNNLVFLTN